LYCSTLRSTSLTSLSCVSFFFNDPATTEIYTLSLHDALPIWCLAPAHVRPEGVRCRHGSSVLRRRADALPREGGAMKSEAEVQAMERAREYFRTKSSPASVAELRERIAEPTGAVEALLTPLSAAQAA